jgi:hypothetical protein
MAEAIEPADPAWTMEFRVKSIRRLSGKKPASRYLTDFKLVALSALLSAPLTLNNS